MRSLIAIAAAMTATVFHSGTAHAKISCSSTTACSNPIVVLNQNYSTLVSSWNDGTGQTQLCGPSSVAMALSSLLRDGFTAKSGTVLKSYSGLGSYSRVDYLAKLMSANRYTGVTWEAWSNTFAARAGEFNADFTSSKAYNSTTLAINASRILSHMKAGRNPVYNLGRYTKKCDTYLNGASYCSLERVNGHIMAVKAVSTSTNAVTFVDPFNASTFSQVLKRIPTTTSTGAPITWVLSSRFSTSTAYYGHSTSTQLFLAELLGSVGGAANRIQ